MGSLNMSVVELDEPRHVRHIANLIQEIQFKRDLLQASMLELEFLREVDARGDLYSKEVVHRAVYRYEKHWMPFLAEVSSSIETDLNFCPPIDIHWVWHVHMLAPVSYFMDCVNVTGRLLGHQLTTSVEREALQEATRKVWEQKFPGEPWNLETRKHGGQQAEHQNGLVSKIGYNIEEAAGRQRVFYYQVSLPHYADPEFHTDSLRRYKMYLYLKKKNPKTFLVPCYDMDLIWHSHQVHPQEYQADMTAILGFVLKHDDSVNDRTEGSKLNSADDVTRRMWMDEFNVPFARPGSMFRGNPPQGKLFEITQDFQRSLLAPREMDVTVSRVKISDLPPTEDSNLLLSVQLETEDPGQKSNKRKKTELYCNLLHLNDTNDMEVD